MLNEFALVDYSAGALVAIVVLLILTGQLVPRRHIRDIIRDRDQWRENSETNAETLRRNSDQLTHLTRTMDAIYSYVRALPRSAADPRADQEDRQ